MVTVAVLQLARSSLILHLKILQITNFVRDILI